jgi:hypothetical protein
MAGGRVQISRLQGPVPLTSEVTPRNYSGYVAKAIARAWDEVPIFPGMENFWDNYLYFILNILPVKNS